MSSSDSDNDYFGNVSKKLQNLIKNYTEDKIPTVTLLNDSTASQDDSLDEDDAILDQIIAQSTRQTWSQSERGAESKRRGSGSGTQRGRGRKNIPNKNVTTATNLETVPNETTNSFNNTKAASARGGPRARPRARLRRDRNLQLLGSGLKRNTRRRRNVQSRSPIYPTYSVGNTEEYLDTSENVQLFNCKPQIQEDYSLELDENEELSVKVYWRSSEVVKFKIRRFQKISQIFDFFVNRENITINKLLFTYNDKILKPNDTPDKFDYNIAKFIDGGIVNSAYTVYENNVDVEKGINLKFQCQNVKKPFIVYVQKDEKLNRAMIKCAEHLDKQINNLKFVFDGDAVSGGTTPADLDLEGGECIDVKIK